MVREGLASTLQSLRALGLDGAKLSQLWGEAAEGKAVTLRLEAEEKCIFIKKTVPELLLDISGGWLISRPFRPFRP